VITIRPAEPGDAEATRAIYNPEVLESTVTFDLRPRSLEEQRAWIAEHAGGHIAIVAVDDGSDGQGPGHAGASGSVPCRRTARGRRTRPRSRTRSTSGVTARARASGGRS